MNDDVEPAVWAVVGNDEVTGSVCIEETDNPDHTAESNGIGPPL